MNDVFRVYPSATVVDRPMLMKLETSELQKAMTEIYKYKNSVDGLPLFAPNVVFVESFAKFFKLDTLMDRIDNPGIELSILLEHYDIDFSEKDRKILLGAALIKEIIAAKVAAKAPVITYPFVTVPSGWSIENNLRFKGTKYRTVRRVDQNVYSIGMKAAELVWNWAAPQWAGGEPPTPELSVSVSGYKSREVIMRPGHVNVGCQRIYRHELEQLALHAGWTIPEIRKGI